MRALDTKLADAGVYNRLVQRRVRVWMDVRNHAGRGEFEKIGVADAREMLTNPPTA
jgi:hypothetical protein